VQALPPAQLGRFRLDACGVSVLCASGAAGVAATALAINATAHLAAGVSAAAPAPWPASWAALGWDPAADGSW
jgi:hypothetical protein